MRAAKGEHALSITRWVLGVYVLRLLALKDGADDVHQDVGEEDEEDGMREVVTHKEGNSKCHNCNCDERVSCPFKAAWCILLKLH